MDGRLKCSLALVVAAEAQQHRAGNKRQESFLVLARAVMKTCNGSMKSIGAECTYFENFQLGGPEKLTGADDPRHALQENGGLADFWYLYDGDILCHPMLVLPRQNRCRTSTKTESFFCVSDLDNSDPDRHGNALTPTMES